MIIKLTVTALVLTLVPATSFAYNCSARGHQAQSCTPGSTWDNVQQSCVKQAPD